MSFVDIMYFSSTFTSFFGSAMDELYVRNNNWLSCIL